MVPATKPPTTPKAFKGPLLHVAGTDLTLDQRAAQLETFRPHPGVASGGRGQWEDDDMDENYDRESEEAWGEGGGGGGVEANGELSLGLGQHVSAYSRNRWRAAQVIKVLVFVLLTRPHEGACFCLVN